MYCGSHAHALADSPGEILTKNGLKQVGPLYVLDAEVEAKKKLGEVRRLSRPLKSAKLQQELHGTAQDHQALIQNLNTQIGQIKVEINGGQPADQSPPAIPQPFRQHLCAVAVR